MAGEAGEEAMSSITLEVECPGCHKKRLANKQKWEQSRTKLCRSCWLLAEKVQDHSGFGRGIPLVERQRRRAFWEEIGRERFEAAMGS